MWRYILLSGACLAFVGTWSAIPAKVAAASGNQTVVFIGTMGSGPGQGIHSAIFDDATGHLTGGELAVQAERPTWLEMNSQRPVLYAVSETGNDGKSQGGVLSFAVEQPGSRLRLLNRVDSGGGGATHLAYDPKASALIVANFGGGQVGAFPIQPDGALGPLSSVQTNYGSGPHRRQTGPHAHGVAIDPSERFILVPDMGADRIFVYHWDRDSRSLSPAATPFAAFPPGSGPRHLAFSPGGHFAFLVAELSSEIYTLRWNPETGAITEAARIALDASDYTGAKGASEIAISRDGRFLYALNRAQHAVQAYAIDQASGALAHLQTIPSGGQVPWHMQIDPQGKWMIVVNQGTGTLNVFAIDKISGQIAATPHVLAIPKPVNVIFYRPRP